MSQLRQSERHFAAFNVQHENNKNNKNKLLIGRIFDSLLAFYPDGVACVPRIGANDCQMR
jgi:hypothetical protein